MPVLISLTTVPARMAGLAPVLESLLAQGADGVVLAVPRAWRRFPGEHALPEVPDGVTLLRCDDMGPATKILPVRSTFPEADVVYCDDDCLYEPEWLSSLIAGHGVRAASVFDVARLRRTGGRVAQGFAGVRVPAGAILPQLVSEEVWLADDIWLSAHWEAASSTITAVPEARSLVRPFAAPGSLQDDARAETYRRAAEYAHQVLGVWPPLPERWALDWRGN